MLITLKIVLQIVKTMAVGNNISHPQSSSTAPVLLVLFLVNMCCNNLTVYQNKRCDHQVLPNYV